MESLFTLLKSLEPSSQVAVGFLAVLGLCAAKLFSGRTPLRVKLVVFFTLTLFATGALVLSGRNALAQADKAAPPSTVAGPGASPAPAGPTPVGVLELLRVEGVARADSGPEEGWIYVGRYEGRAGHWTDGPTVALPDPARPPRSGEVVVAQRGCDYYDDQPRYSLFSQTWKLGRKVGEFEKGRRLVMVGDPLALGQNLWCRVRPEPRPKASERLSPRSAPGRNA